MKQDVPTRRDIADEKTQGAKEASKGKIRNESNEWQDQHSELNRQPILLDASYAHYTSTPKYRYRHSCWRLLLRFFYSPSRSLELVAPRDLGKLLLARLLVVAADCAPELFAPGQGKDGNPADCEKVALLHGMDRIVVASRASNKHIPISLQRPSKVLGTKHDEEEHGGELGSVVSGWC